MNRKCGTCTLCCKLLPVHHESTDLTLKKPALERCPFQRFHKGCTIHNTERYPDSCRRWSCMWLLEQVPEGIRRPDRIGYVIDVLPDMVSRLIEETGEIVSYPVIQVWVDPSKVANGTFEIDEALWGYMEKLGDQGWGILFREGSERAHTFVKDQETGTWLMGGGDKAIREKQYTADQIWKTIEESGASRAPMDGVLDVFKRGLGVDGV